MAEQQTVDGAKIRLLRVQKDWSAEELAKQSELSTTYIYKIEKGEATPSIPVLTKIANALGVETIDLFSIPNDVDLTVTDAKGIRNYLVHKSNHTVDSNAFMRFMANYLDEELSQRNITSNSNIAATDFNDTEYLVRSIRGFMGDADQQLYRTFRNMAGPEIVVSLSKAVQLKTDEDDLKDVLLMILAIFFQRSSKTVDID